MHTVPRVLSACTSALLPFQSITGPGPARPGRTVPPAFLLTAGAQVAAGHGDPPFPFLDKDAHQAAASDVRSARRPANDATGVPLTLRLYVSRGSLNCERAIRTVERVMAEIPPHVVTLHVIDVAVDTESAARDRVLYTPTLVLTDRRARTTHVLGSLANPGILLDVLHASGLEPI